MELILKTELFTTLMFTIFLIVATMEIAFLRTSYKTGNLKFKGVLSLRGLLKKEVIKPLGIKNYFDPLIALVLPILTLVLIYFFNINSRFLAFVALFLCAEHLRKSKYSELTIVATNFVLSLFIFTSGTIPWVILSLQFILFLNSIHLLKTASIIFYSYLILYFGLLWFLKPGEITILISLLIFPMIYYNFIKIKNYLPKLKLSLSENYTWFLIILSFCVEGILI